MSQPFVFTGHVLSICFAAVLGFVPLAAVAGPKDGGGGKGIQCLEKGEYRTYLADTFRLIRSGAFNNKMKFAEPSAVILAAAELVERMRPAKTFAHPYKKNERVSLAWMIEHKYASIDFNYAPPGQSLEDFPDDYIDPKSLPQNCRKVQIAIQDLATGVVTYDMRLENSMSKIERGFLELHEVLIALRNQPGEDTTPIRGEVDRIADVLRDPKFSFHKLVKGMILPKDIGFEINVKIGKSTASKNLFKKCKSMLIDSEAQPGDTEEVAFCRRVSADLRAEDDRAHRELALPTLQEMPQTLRCWTTYQGENSFGWRNPRMFHMNRLTDDGTPNSPSTYTLHFASGVRSEKSKNARLSTDPFMRGGAVSAHGDFRFFSTWNTAYQHRMTLFLDQVSERTKEFSGRIQLAMDDANDGRYTSYGVVCDGSQAHFEINSK